MSTPRQKLRWEALETYLPETGTMPCLKTFRQKAMLLLSPACPCAWVSWLAADFIVIDKGTVSGCIDLIATGSVCNAILLHAGSDQLRAGPFHCFPWVGLDQFPGFGCLFFFFCAVVLVFFLGSLAWPGNSFNYGPWHWFLSRIDLLTATIVAMSSNKKKLPLAVVPYRYAWRIKGDLCQ